MEMVGLDLMKLDKSFFFFFLENPACFLVGSTKTTGVFRYVSFRFIETWVRGGKLLRIVWIEECIFLALGKGGSSAPNFIHLSHAGLLTDSCKRTFLPNSCIGCFEEWIGIRMKGL